ncbi:hypothetical protein RRF57_009554 [Xylaria bambusicola]|uniref:WSC domain-containing protein n=1 Tax=Xylaria bambusicola TaxID=326684 RepID=A0AAN7UZK3_9PEZI
MARLRCSVPFLAAIASIILITAPGPVQSLDMEYCASMNTAETPTNSSIWQSNGLCHDFCIDHDGTAYAFAIVQSHSCWCSDYIPAESDQVDTSKCSDACPGWKPDTCGAEGLYGYIALGLTPSGTADASSSTSTTEQTSTPTVETSSTVTSTVDSITSTTTTKSSTITTIHDSTSSKTTDETTTTPTTSIKTVTAGGTVSYETVTVLPTTTPDPGTGSGPNADHGGTTTSSKGLSSGAAAGVAIGVLALVAIIGGIAVFFWLQRKKRRQEEELHSRPRSHLSCSQGMMSTPTTTMASIWDGENTSTGRRNSRLMPHDPRMDPFATNIYTRFENKSRESINTLQDNQDYSRKVLRTTNPDPPDQ